MQVNGYNYIFFIVLFYFNFCIFKNIYFNKKNNYDLINY